MNKTEWVTAELALDTKSKLGEGPHWNRGLEQLLFVDIVKGLVHVFQPGTKEHDIHSLDGMPSSVIPIADGGWAVTMQDGVYRYNPQQRELSLVVQIEADLPGNRFNDAKCDPSGRLWAGTMDIGFQDYTGSLYLVEADGRVRTMLSQVGCSNGIAWDERKGAMYYIDTMKPEVCGFRYDAATGEISERRKLLEWPSNAGSPDGMTIDAEGQLWIAHWGGGRVSRWNPDTGELLGELAVPAPNVTSCVFGGAALDELYITTAREGLSASELDAYPLAGGLFVAKPGVTGTASRRFG
ncbi:SMP-30/gluconolactonase/LRE family protein [Paenibacillus sp. PL2-23]|uniref:SMP-30/gluconolactonase/LRE family protein n=1 Tax=Paenibacillus sp. PL2-23 TaxID=2100729 RepID=UPI0030FC4457